MSRRVALCSVLVLLFVTPTAVAQIAGTRWFPIGPAPVGGFFSGGVAGRATSIAVNRWNTNEIWIGTAAGGVWHTIDGGAHWTPQSDKEDSLAIGAVAVDDCTGTGCNAIYAGTGENAIRRDTYYGRGLLVGQKLPGDSTLWKLRTGTPYDFNFGSINDVVLDPNTIGRTKRIFITLSTGVTAASPESTVTAPAPSGGVGIYRTDDEGVTWQKLTVTGSGTALPTDLKMDPNNHDVLFAGFAGRGVFRSTDGGNTWCPLNQGIAAPFGCPIQTLPDVRKLTFDHVEIALTAGFRSLMYATFGLCPDRLWQSCRPAVWVSADRGVSWSQQNAGEAKEDGERIAYAYTRYTHALAIDPSFDNDLLLGGLDLWSSTDAGVNFNFSDHNLLDPPDRPGVHDSTHIIHPDHHDIVFPDSFSGEVYDANDGGFAISIDRGANWFSRNGNLQITEFQGIGSSALTPAVIGASQDNASELWTGSARWTFLPTFGDGGFAFLDADDAMTMYVGSNFGDMLRSQDGGMHWSDIFSHDWLSDPRSFYAVCVQAPTVDGSGKHPVYYGSNRLFRSQDAGSTWTKVSPVLATGSVAGIITAPDPATHLANPSGAQNVITAVAISPSDPTHVYVGYFLGQVFRSQGPKAPCEDDPNCWTSARGGLPLAPITRIAVHPTNPDIAFATVSGFGGYAHVWKTVNGGGSWTPIVTGLPAGVPANTISLEPSAPQNLWLGLDGAPGGASLFKSTNGGASWVPFASGLPNAPIYEISVDETHGRVYAGTHGRGAFVLGPAFIINLENSTGGRIHDLALHGQNFLPNKPCTTQLLQSNGHVCASGSVDVMGGTIATDSGGVLRTSLDGMWSGHDIAWACLDGTCLGGVPIASCYADAPLSRIAVTCGEQTATASVGEGLPLNDPPGGAIEIAGGEAAGMLQITAGALCTVGVPFRRVDADDATLTRAADAVNANATCAANHVVALVDHGRGGSGEDEFARRPRLLLQAKGVQVIAGMHLDAGSGTGSAIRVDGIGVPVLGRLEAVKLDVATLPGGAAGGGTLTITEESPLGTCTIAVPTLAGETKGDIAQAIVSAVQATGIPGPHRDCPSDRNPRDISIRNGSLVSVVARALELRTTDPKVGLDLRAAELANAHPVANAGGDFAVPAGAPVVLDASRSSDPDSTPGTHDDIARFEWSEVTTGTPQLLGSTETLEVPLTAGTHRIRLRVTDRGGLSDTNEIKVTVQGGSEHDIGKRNVP